MLHFFLIKSNIFSEVLCPHFEENNLFEIRKFQGADIWIFRYTYSYDYAIQTDR